MNRCPVPPLRVDEKLPAHDLQPLLHAGQAEPRPSDGFVRVEAGARVLDCQIDGADLTVQRDLGASRHAMLDDILEGFLQDAVETEGDLRWQRLPGCSRNARQS